MNENEFVAYLREVAKNDDGTPLAKGSQKTVLSNIKTSIPKELHIDSLFDIEDISTLRNYYNKIDGTFFNTKRKYSPTHALKHYINFNGIVS
ncbi:MAG: hypothetical protein JXQ76_01650 [Campylobacterales bacterium]|nr:hypothetical protein [Campylobacterales bacterium]